MSLVSTYYKNILLGIQRGNHCGVFSNAKPYFLLAVISCIDENTITENNIILSEALIKKYNANTMLFISITSLIMMLHLLENHISILAQNPFIQFVTKME